MLSQVTKRVMLSRISVRLVRVSVREVRVSLGQVSVSVTESVTLDKSVCNKRTD